MTSSERRKYIPIDYISPNIIPGSKIFVAQNISKFHFGVLTSIVHMAWMRAVCGRLKSDYAYSNLLVYNTFIWCQPSESQLKKIEQTAQLILSSRKNYLDASLADLYDPLLMPKDLRDAHKANDKAVLEAYGFSTDLNESEILSELMALYQKFIEKMIKKILHCEGFFL